MVGRILLVFLVFVSSPLLALEISSQSSLDNAEYFAEFYSYDGLFHTARQSHSFARFFKKEDGKVVEVTDISWLPAPGNFGRRNRVPLLATVAGANYSLEQTMAIAGGKPITSHGQFAISPEMYRAAVLRKAELEAGSYAYKLFNGSGRGALNCIEALSGVIGHLHTGLRRGFGATSSIVSFFESSGQMGSEWNSRKEFASNAKKPAASSSPVVEEVPKQPPVAIVESVPEQPQQQPAPAPVPVEAVPESTGHTVISSQVIVERPVRRPLLQRFRNR